MGPGGGCGVAGRTETVLSVPLAGVAPRLFVPEWHLNSLGAQCCTRAYFPHRHKVQLEHRMDERPGDSAMVGGQRPPRLVGANAGHLALLVPHQRWRPAALLPLGRNPARRHRGHPDQPGQEVRSNRPRRQGNLNLLRPTRIGNNLPPFIGCAHRCVLSLAPLCRYSNTHPDSLQNPLGVCVPVYKYVYDTFCERRYFQYAVCSTQ